MLCKVYRTWTLLGREWRWTVYALNGLKLANSGEGYKNKQHCVDMVRKLLHPDIVIHVQE
jgi:Holliday junction resolvasome RuvABC endonuclease subunit